MMTAAVIQWTAIGGVELPANATPELSEALNRVASALCDFDQPKLSVAELLARIEILIDAKREVAIILEGKRT
jgi:hypothetical protein